MWISLVPLLANARACMIDETPSSVTPAVPARYRSPRLVVRLQFVAVREPLIVPVPAGKNPNDEGLATESTDVCPEGAPSANQASPLSNRTMSAAPRPN